MTEPTPGDPFRPADPSSPASTPHATPVAVGPVRRRGGGTLVNAMLGLALVVAVGGLAFAAGRMTAPAAAAATGPGFGGNGGIGRIGPLPSGAPGGAIGGGFGGGALSLQGTVTGVDADSITLELTSGQSITISTDDRTTYHERSTASASAVTTGSTVIVQLPGGRGALGAGDNGPRASGAPLPSGEPTQFLGAATTVTVVPGGG